MIRALRAYGLTRLIAGALIVLAAVTLQRANGGLGPSPGYLDMVGTWDGRWYARIAAGGYPLPVPRTIVGSVAQSEWAFYPLFPLIVRPLTRLGLSFTVASALVNLLAGAAGVAVLDRLLRAGTTPRHRRVVTAAVVLWLLSPATAVLQMAYTEALAMFLLVLTLLLLVRRHYLTAGLVALLVGVTRGIAVPVAVVAITHLVLRIRQERARGEVPLAGQRMSAAVMIACTAAASVAWPAFVGWRTGAWSTFFDVQAAWGQRPDRGPFVSWLMWCWTHGGVLGVIALVVLVVGMCALVLSRFGAWMPVEARAWGVAYPVYLVALTAPSTSVVRFLVLDFPLAAAWAALGVRGVARVRPGVPRGALIAVVAVVAVGLMWWWTSSLLVFDPPADWPP